MATISAKQHASHSGDVWSSSIHFLPARERIETDGFPMMFLNPFSTYVFPAKIVDSYSDQSPNHGSL
ncbi:hypothetical protein Hanom_Chr06g00559271 [Helianthus anomalus]